MRPIFRARHQAGAHWILPDIVGLKLKSFLRPNTVIEIIALPADPRASRGEALPAADNLRHVLFHWKPGNHVEVIRHEQKDEKNPTPLPVIEGSILDQASRGRRGAELILCTGLATNGDKKPRISDRDGWDVLQCLP